MEQVKKGAASVSRTRSIAFVGLAVAIMAVSAWVTVPLGPVPFTLQMFAITFAIVMLSPKASPPSCCTSRSAPSVCRCSRA